MPELPEVETIRRQLEREVVGKKVKTAEIRESSLIERMKTRKAFTAGLEGAKLKSLVRRGTWLMFTLDTGDLFLISLGGEGRVRKAAAKDEIVDGTMLILTPTTGGSVRIIDPKGQTEAMVTSPEELPEIAPDFVELGHDLVDEPLPWRDFARTVLSREVKLKTLLTDPTIFAGIGPMYADEILHDAGLRHDRLSNDLSVQEVRRLSRSVVEKLHDAIKHGGTTLEDQAFLDLNGEPGGFLEYHEVFQRDGQACRRCRNTVSKVKFGGRNTYLCESCQV